MKCKMEKEGEVEERSMLLRCGTADFDRRVRPIDYIGTRPGSRPNSAVLFIGSTKFSRGEVEKNIMLPRPYFGGTRTIADGFHDDLGIDVASLVAT